MAMKQEEFTVDASLLRELGERLIGRPAIALGELIKNSYDADARHCEKIVISDDGSGMSETEFLKHWMRIGTTHKVDTGRSKKLGRAFTGSKGVGRLSVQFLADEMTMESSSEQDPAKQLYVTMDWRKAVRGTDLDTVKVLWESRNEGSTYAAGSSVGTRIELKKLKTTWDGDAIGDLGRDVWMLRSPFRLFAKRTSADDTDFDIQIDAPDIEGAREAFDQVMTTLFSRWKARIRGTLENGRTGNEGPRLNVVFQENYPDKGLERQAFRETVHLPTRPPDPQHKNRVNVPLIDRCKFEILVFKPEGKQAGGINVADMREYLAEYGNVSVYDAGFRLPYYGAGREAAGQDWLGIAIDQGRRLNASELLPAHLQSGTRYMQDLPAPGRIFGAVDIDTNHERSVAEGLAARGESGRAYPEA